MTLPKRIPTSGPAHRTEERQNKLRFRKSYVKPRLRRLGKVEQTILSPSPGTFESGNGAGFKP